MLLLAPRNDEDAMALGRIAACELPAESLLRNYREAGAYTDCYSIDVAGAITQAGYVEAFYTTWVFKLERLLLAWFIARPSTDAQAKALARSESDSFAAWSVEGRTADQLLMCDLNSRTRSWLMSATTSTGGASGTRLYFGSAVVPVTDPKTGQKTMGAIFRALLGFHRLYSRVLLRAAVSRLARAATGSDARP